ncbi:hypothetical protein JTE90_026301, partial [Oedothorax gibbosus]
MAAIRNARHDPDSESPIDYVQIDGLVVLKIIKHCHEEGGWVFLMWPREFCLDWVWTTDWKSQTASHIQGTPMRKTLMK